MTKTPRPADRDLVEVLRRWEDSGAVWQVVTRSAGAVTVALCRCDGGEEADRFSTGDPRLLAYIGERSGSAC